MSWRRILAGLALVAAGCAPGASDDERLAVDGARSTALLFWTTKGEGSEVPGAHVAGVQRDGGCYAVRVRGTAGGGGDIVILRRPPRGEPVLHGWEIVGAGGFSMEQLDATKANCGFFGREVVSGS